jgi:hypothetical protein
VLALAEATMATSLRAFAGRPHTSGRMNALLRAGIQRFQEKTLAELFLDKEKK